MHRAPGSRFQADLFHFRSLTDPEANRKIPELVGRTYFNLRFEQFPTGGSADLELSATALSREQGTDRLAAAGRFGWSHSWVTGSGIELTTRIRRHRGRLQLRRRRRRIPVESKPVSRVQASLALEKIEILPYSRPWSRSLNWFGRLFRRNSSKRRQQSYGAR